MEKGEIALESNRWTIYGDDDPILLKKENWEHLPKWLDSTPVEFKKNEKGYVISIVDEDGKEHPERRDSQRENKTKSIPDKRPKSSSYQSIGKEQIARAPYNFVPLNENVTPYSIEIEEDKHITQPPSHNTFDLRFNSGYIDLDMKVKTPLFIRGTGSKFLKINKNPILPGSSLRGMIRNLVEIASESKIVIDEQIRNKRFFYRDVANSSGQYRKAFTEEDERGNFYWSRVRCGWLKSSSKNFFLTPMLCYDEIYFYRTLQNNNSYRTDVIKEIYFDPEPSEEARWKKKGRFDIEYNTVQCSENLLSKNQVAGLIIKTGNIKGKHYDWVFTPPDTSKSFSVDAIIEELQKDIDNQQDKNKTRKAVSRLDKWIEKARHTKYGTPVFYLEDSNGKPKYIGTTGFFRLPYEHTVEDFLPSDHQESETGNKQNWDMAEAIFGTTEKSGRVFFEDGILNESSRENHGEFKDYLPESIPQILSDPKITTYQHYIEQKDNNGLTDWNGKSIIRGFKQYWHKSSKEWNKYSKVEFQNKNNGEKTKILNQHSHFIAPIKPENQFISRIRFDNLTNEELGCLLFVLDLPEKDDKEYCCHKLGMGKPLGLGSIKIKPEITLTNRKARYTDLFDKKDWETGEQKHEKESHKYQSIKESFAKWAGSDSVENLWNTSRFEQLKAMMLFDEKRVNGKEAEDWSSKTSYMELKEFKDKKILPKSSNV